MQKKVISGFPGVGKSWLQQNQNGLVVSDSDSSSFSWKNQDEKIRNPEWPNNYIGHIKAMKEATDIIFVSTHKEVRDAMVQACIPFTLVYPSLEMKEEYIARYVARGNVSSFVKLLEQNYEAWITELMMQKHCIHIVLRPGQYLSDVL